jgi:hypothetical protein
VEPVPASAVLNTELAHERALMAWSADGNAPNCSEFFQGLNNPYGYN